MIADAMEDSVNPLDRGDFAVTHQDLRSSLSDLATTLRNETKAQNEELHRRINDHQRDHRLEHERWDGMLRQIMEKIDKLLVQQHLLEIQTAQSEAEDRVREHVANMLAGAILGVVTSAAVALFAYWLATR